MSKQEQIIHLPTNKRGWMIATEEIEDRVYAICQLEGSNITYRFTFMDIEIVSPDWLNQKGYDYSYDV